MAKNRIAKDSKIAAGVAALHERSLDKLTGAYVASAKVAAAPMVAALMGAGAYNRKDLKEFLLYTGKKR